MSLGLVPCSCSHQTLFCCWLQELSAEQTWPVSHTRCNGSAGTASRDAEHDNTNPAMAEITSPWCYKHILS